MTVIKVSTPTPLIPPVIKIGKKIFKTKLK
jgi:hypothetical protein